MYFSVVSQLQGIPGSSSMVAVDCSNTGAGTLVLKPITFKNIVGDQTVKATFDIPVSNRLSSIKTSPLFHLKLLNVSFELISPPPWISMIEKRNSCTLSFFSLLHKVLFFSPILFGAF